MSYYLSVIQESNIKSVPWFEDVTPLLLLKILTLNTGWSEIAEEWKVIGSLGAASSEEVSAFLKD